ncbi:MAG: class I SAM-dependent methyltransferase [Flavobacteriales bacterium]|nr:class I SAM-dependent methyltransferase [Flavobacteriales bacterium]
MKTYQICPICEKKKFSHFLHCKDNTGSNEAFSIVKCNNCNFAFTNPIPLEDQIGKYYESDEYISHSNSKKGLVNFLYQKVRNHTLNKKLALLKSLSSGRALLDIGSGTGEFLNQCNLNGFTIEGIEPSKKGRDQAKNNFNINIKTEEELSQFKDSSFDFISMWHVLEHVYHLNDRIKELHRLIKNDGHIVIAVPNLNSLDAKQYKEFWAAYDVPRHLYHFSPNDIKNLGEKHGLKMVKTLPMKFDSYYVSMLSEKYKTGNTNIFSGFLTGFKSNNKANPSKTYSSQIYILKKDI